MVDINRLQPLSLDPTLGTTLDQPLPLDAPQQRPIGGPADILPEERASGFRNFVERIGLTGPSLLNTLSLAFGQSTQEIENRRRSVRRRQIEDQIFEREAKLMLAGRRGEIVEGPGGRSFFAETGELVVPGQQPKPPKPTALQEKITALQSTGLNEQTATGLATGRFGITFDPVTRESFVVDKATGQRVGEAPQRPAAAPSPEAPPIITPPVDIGQALGPTGVVRTAVNRIVDLFGGELPFEETSIAAAQLSNLNNEAIQLLRAGLGGRPNVQLQRRVEKLLVEPNEIFGGEQEAKNKFQALINTIDTEATRVTRDIEGGGLRPVTVDKARQRLSELQSLSAKFRSILESQAPQDRGDINRFFR